MIYIQKLSKRYGEMHALDNISLLIQDGELVALLGPNGSGKSTLFRSLLGIQDYQGSVRINGIDPLKNGKQARTSIGYMPQHSGLHHDLTVQETLAFYCKLKNVGQERATSLLARLNLSHKLDSRVGELSGGMRQRLSFAVAMLSDPAILLLDEPTASLDSESQALILGWLTELHAQGKTILISTHSKQDIMALAVRAITLEEGKLYSDVPLRKNVKLSTNIIEKAGGAVCYAA
jgi:ABC-type multidrug transport system ATPase subunit